MFTKKSDTRENKLAIWFSSILRLSLGLLFMIMGYIYSKDENTWIIVVFGLILFATGFMRPKRCIDEQCEN